MTDPGFWATVLPVGALLVIFFAIGYYLGRRHQRAQSKARLNSVIERGYKLRRDV